MGRLAVCFRYLRHSILTSLRSQELIRNACFLVQLFDLGENLSFFLTVIDMDDFEPIVGGVWNVFVNFFDDGGVVDTADDIDEGLKVEGVQTTCFGVRFHELVDIDRIHDGDVDDEVETVGFPRPRCGDPLFPPIGNKYVNNKVKTAGFPRPRCGKTGFLSVNNTIGWSIDLPSWISGWIIRFGGMVGWWSLDILVCFGRVMKLVWCCADDSKMQIRAVEQITEASLSKNESSKWEGVNEGSHINAQTAAEEFEYSFLCTYVLEFLCTCMLRISVEEYGYLFHRKVQDQLVRKLNCHCVTQSTDLKFSYPSTRIG